MRSRLDTPRRAARGRVDDGRRLTQKRDKSTTLIRILPLFALVRTEYNIKREWARTIDNTEAPSISSLQACSATRQS